MSDTAEPVVHAEDVWLRFPIHYHRADVTLREAFVRWFERRREGRRARDGFWALRGVSLTARSGEVLGIIGVNGSGKTTLLKVVGGICAADRGHVHVHGKVGCLLSFGVGFNMTLNGRENIYLNGSVLGLSRREIDRYVDTIIDFSELGDFIDAPVRTYSAGMRGRLGFSIAAHLQPEILLLDEALSTGDAGFRAKAGSIVHRLRDDRKIILISSHNMPLIRSVCTRVIWLEKGTIRAEGDPTEITRAYVEQQRQVRQIAGDQAALQGDDITRQEEITASTEDSL